MRDQSMKTYLLEMLMNEMDESLSKRLKSKTVKEPVITIKPMSEPEPETDMAMADSDIAEIDIAEIDIAETDIAETDMDMSEPDSDSDMAEKDYEEEEYDDSRLMQRLKALKKAKALSDKE